MSQPEFGARLRTKRVEAGLSQKEVAGEELTPSYISLLENGSRVPSLSVVIRLARLLHTTPQELLGYEIEGLGGPGGREPSDLVAQVEVRRLTGMGDLTGARAILRDKVAAARAAGDDEAVLTYGLELLTVAAASGDAAERLALLDQLEEVPATEHTAPLKVVLAVDRASTLRELGRVREAHAVATAARDRMAGGPLAGTVEHVRLLGVLASILAEESDFEQAGTVIEEMVSRAIAGGHVGVLGRTHWIASMAYARMGNSDDAYAQLQAAHDTLVAGALSVHDWLRFCRFTASILIEDGRDIDGARDWIRASELTARMAGLPADLAAARRELAHIEFTAGNPQAAAEIYEELVQTPATLGNNEAVVYSGLSDALAELERFDEAIEWQRHAAEIYETDDNFRRAAEAWRKIDALRRLRETEVPTPRATKTRGRPVPSRSRGRDAH